MMWVEVQSGDCLAPFDRAQLELDSIVSMFGKVTRDGSLGPMRPMGSLGPLGPIGSPGTHGVHGILGFPGPMESLVP